MLEIACPYRNGALLPGDAVNGGGGEMEAGVGGSLMWCSVATLRGW